MEVWTLVRPFWSASLSLAGTVVVVSFALLIFRIITLGIYNIYFHPLAKFPGPKRLTAFRLPYSYHSVTGRLPHIIKQAHDHYGEVVRIAPDELSFISAHAWQDIYGRMNPEIHKDVNTFLPADPMGKFSMLMAGSQDHARVKARLGPAFSWSAVWRYQDRVSNVLDVLVEKLRSRAGKSGVGIDMNLWICWFVYDVAGDLVYGKLFGSLEAETWARWPKALHGTVKLTGLLGEFHRYDLLRILNRLTPERLRLGRSALIQSTKNAVDGRLKEGNHQDKRPDFMTFVLNSLGKNGVESLDLSEDEMASNAETLVLGATETIATLLNGFLYLLLRHRPDCFARAVKEVRETFASDDRSIMNFRTVQSLPYMTICINETLRFYPPTPMGLPRRIVDAGYEVAGYAIPPNTSVQICQWAAYRSVRNWTRVDEFLPERWRNTGEKENLIEFENDEKDVLQAFSVGPRRCMGRNLAIVETRLTIARLLWNFDLELCPGQEDWINTQGQFFVWEKKPLYMKLTPVVRD